jgi:hypothetical protein
LHQREPRRLLWQLFFGRTLRAGIRRAEAGGAEIFVDAGRLSGSYQPRGKVGSHFFSISGWQALNAIEGVSAVFVSAVTHPGQATLSRSSE